MITIGALGFLQPWVLAALAALELSVVLDVKMTATAKLASYVFGCKLSFEKPGTSRTAEAQLDVPFAQYTPALLHPDFDVIEEWEFFWGLAHRMRTPLRLANGAVLDLDRKPTPDQYLDLTHRDSRIPLDEVRRHPSVSDFAVEAPTLSELFLAAAGPSRVSDGDHGAGS